MPHRPLVTFGHSTARRDALGKLLRAADVEAVVDVRTAPGSRHNPDVARKALQEWLPEYGIGYRWEQDLGGFRNVPDDSPDVIWRNTAFRGYSGYSRTPPFLAAMDRLLSEAAETATAVMCSEAVWWRCHRRIIADFTTLARHVPVLHLMHDGRLVPHPPMPGARLRSDGLLVYDAGTAAEG
ncbi:MAG TPA: DUF488 domain-containing protein [Streptomyces sp.]|nr:DUF488 domain-containing protein [Streptomyces sp.]